MARSGIPRRIVHRGPDQGLIKRFPGGISNYPIRGSAPCTVNKKSNWELLIFFSKDNCVYGFDLATENSLTQGSKLISDEIVFSNRILTDYFESVGNRVLSIDDFSSES